MVSMPPWGERGPAVDDPATPDLVAAAAGIFWNQQSYTEAPVHLVVPVVAYGTGTLGALALAAGLLARERDGVAPTYEVSWVAGAAAIQLGDTQGDGPVEERPGSAPMGSKGRVPCYRLFEAGDGRWFFLACGTPRFFERLLHVIGRPDLVGDPRLPDPPWGLVDPDALAFLVPILEGAFATRPRAEWLAALGEADIPAQPVQTREEYVASDLAAANRLVIELDHPDLGPLAMMGVPLVMEAAPGRVRRAAPRLGEHTDEVRAELADAGPERRRRAPAPFGPAHPAGAPAAAARRAPGHRPGRVHRRPGRHPPPGHAGGRRRQGRAAHRRPVPLVRADVRRLEPGQALDRPRPGRPGRPPGPLPAGGGVRRGGGELPPRRGRPAGLRRCRRAPGQPPW